MKREEIKQIFPEATDEQLKAVMDLNGSDVEKVKSKVTALETDLKEKKADFEKLNTEFEALKTANASGEDWKAKFEALQAENVAKEKQAIAEKAEKEKEENNRSMFEKAVIDYGKTLDDFYNEHTKKGCYEEFVKAIGLEENVGKAHKDVLHAIVKDDGTYWKGVTAFKLKGGVNKGVGYSKSYDSKADIMAIKDPVERQTAIAQNLNLFKGD